MPQMAQRGTAATKWPQKTRKGTKRVLKHKGHEEHQGDDADWCLCVLRVLCGKSKFARRSKISTVSSTESTEEEKNANCELPKQ
jgi:hypothetical protein